MTHSACSERDIELPHSLTLSEGFVNPIGFYDPTPSFSWKLPVSDQVKTQSAYAIVVASDPTLLPDSPDLWNSGKVYSDQSVWVVYEGEPLTLRQKAPYDKRIETLTYDVTDMLHQGQNAIGFILAPAWHSGRFGWTRAHWIKKDPPQVICQLEVILEDGSQETYYSDDTWQVMINGPIRFSEIYDGEIYDANKEIPGWSEGGYPQENWKNVVVEVIDSSVKLMPKRHHPVRNIMALNTKSINHLESGAVIFDLGQNMVGVPQIKVPMIENDTLTIRFAEMLQQDGQLYTENYRTAKSTNYYIAGKTGVADYLPKFTFHGFRYVELSGFDSNAVADRTWVTGIVQHSDFETMGTFTSSHDKLNQLQSVREEQFENGGIPIVVPNITQDRISPGWGDAATIIPWEAFIRTGDKKALKENFSMMKRWVGFYQSNAKDNIVDMFGFGDWLQPYSSGGNRGDTSMDIIATAFYAQSIRLTMKAAGVLGYKEDELELKALLNKVRAAFEETFFDMAEFCQNGN